MLLPCFGFLLQKYIVHKEKEWNNVDERRNTGWYLVKRVKGRVRVKDCVHNVLLMVFHRVGCIRHVHIAPPARDWHEVAPRYSRTW